MSRNLPEISVVLPTFNRRAALEENFRSLQELRGVSEIVVVVDGSTDGTGEWLEALGDSRVRVTHQRQRGSPAARNTGISAARGEWILMTEDDCYLPKEFALMLFEAAESHDAQIVSAPWLPVNSRDQMAPALDRARSRAEARIRLGTHPSVFPAADIETPFLNGIALARRDVFDVIRYDESLGGNAWREETSMFLAATQAGFRCVLTPRTASFQLDRWAGGQRRRRLSYEIWAIRNNWRFLRRHRRILERLGEIHDPFTAQARFVVRRLLSTAAGFTRARWRALARGRGSGERPVGETV